jgi:selenocysteine lyase/cysteine desulfurase
MTFEEARAQFPVFERLAYLNAGTNGPLSSATGVAMLRQERSDVESGRGGQAYFERALELRDRVRAKLASAVGVPAELLSLSTSTTNGCNIVLAGLGLGPEDEVLTTDGEHFGLLGALAASPAQVRVANVRELPHEESLCARPFPRVLGDRQPFRGRGAQAPERPAGARRRRTVGGRDPGRRHRCRLLRVLVPEMALRA